MPIGAAVTWDDVGLRRQYRPEPRGTYLVSRIRGGKRKRRQVRVGAADRALTPNAGLAAVAGLCERLGVIGALDAAVGPVKQRDRTDIAEEVRKSTAEPHEKARPRLGRGPLHYAVPETDEAPDRRIPAETPAAVTSRNERSGRRRRTGGRDLGGLG